MIDFCDECVYACTVSIGEPRIGNYNYIGVGGGACISVTDDGLLSTYLLYSGCLLCTTLCDVGARGWLF